MEREGCGALGRREGGHVQRSMLFQVLAHQLRHLEHVDRRLAAEHRLERVVRLDHPLVLLVLQPVLLDIGPQFLGTSVRGIAFEPTTSESAALGCTGFMKAALGFRFAAFFFAMSSPCEGRPLDALGPLGLASYYALTTPLAESNSSSSPTGSLMDTHGPA